MQIIQAGCTAHKKIDMILKNFSWYRDFLEGHLSPDEYLGKILLNKKTLLLAGLNEDQIHLSTRFPHKPVKKVASILYDLKIKNFIPSVNYPATQFNMLSNDVDIKFHHAGYTTYIFPEEARLLFALTCIQKPKRIVFLGSFYGYWAIWAMPALQKLRGKAYLIDIDKKALAIAKKNMDEFGFGHLVEYINEDAISFLNKTDLSHDMLVLDAEGPQYGDDPDLLEKAIYYPMIKAAFARLSKRGTVICHNILTTHTLPDPYFIEKIKHNETQFNKFLPFVRKNFPLHREYLTTEGVGIFKKL